MSYTKEDVESYFYRYTSRRVGLDCMIKNEKECELYRTYIDIIRSKIKKRNIIKRVFYYLSYGIAAILFFVAPVIFYSYYEWSLAGGVSMAFGGIMLYALIANPLNVYTIYNLIGDIKFHNDYATVFSESCVLVKHWHDVGQNRLTPVSLGREDRFPEHHIKMLGFENLYKKELVAYVILADAMIVDRCLTYHHKEWYSISSDAEVLKLQHYMIIEKYNKEI